MLAGVSLATGTRGFFVKMEKLLTVNDVKYDIEACLDGTFLTKLC